MNAVGFEESFALAILSMMLAILYFIPVNMDQPGGSSTTLLTASCISGTTQCCWSPSSPPQWPSALPWSPASPSPASCRPCIDSGRSVLVWATVPAPEECRLCHHEPRGSHLQRHHPRTVASGCSVTVWLQEGQ